MSKTEIRVWCWLLGMSGAGAAMMYFLPVTVIIVLCYLFVGILLMFAPFVFFISAGTFGVNALISQILPKPFWLRIGISAGLVYGLALILGSLLNTERATAFKHVVSEDVPLASKPAISRLVLVDDRSGPGYGGRHLCDVACKAYLANGAASAVLFPLDIDDRQPVEKRQYEIYSNRIGCAQAQNFDDATHRIWKGGCLTPVRKGKIAIGDVIVHAFQISVPFQSKKCDCERFEVFVQTASGLQLIERQTSFQMTGYGRVPMPSRDAGWNGSNYDHGVSWLHEGSMSHRAYLENMLKDDLGLSPDVYTVQQAINETAARSQTH